MNLITVTQQEFLLGVLNGLDKGDCVTYLYNEYFHSPLGPYFKDGKFQGEDLFRVASFEDLFNALETRDDIAHFIPTLFMKTYSRTRGHTKDYIREKRCMSFDFEGVTPEEIIRRFNQIGLVPYFINRSRTFGYHAHVLHSPIIGTKKAMGLWDAIQNAIVYKVGSDPYATGIRHNFYLPNTIWKCEGTRIYSIDELIDIKKVIDAEIRANKIWNNSGGEILSLTERQILQDPAIQVLLHAKFDIERTSRNCVAFTISLLYYYLAIKQHKNLEDTKLECLEFLTGEWLAKVSYVPKSGEVFDGKEIQCTVNSAFSGDYSGPHTKIISELAGIPCNIHFGSKYVRKSKQEGGRRNQKENIMEILSFLRNSPFSGLQKDLVSSLEKNGMAKRTTTCLIAQLKQEGYISYKAQSGSKSGSEYTLTETGEDFLRLKLVEKDIEDLFEGSVILEGASDEIELLFESAGS
jgi:predicted transcriptional regulator